ncbi:ribose 1,5-bisphosphate phosphokinase PhnN [Desulfolithobacter dissulfuricans]|uniref:Ribose 1,5-bisphosphate phosphokinase PhnN n=1 Tax=Desulfolithobacter dissulfuricans TaxID=2795293 RepID=A0A915XKT1_9BACT|nr:hypothetical protein [Desulfolithobacter dissulfuricans]BCO10407.1 ribose 1,5-bisphosphate phosphokinase PhnN [Desulfolithobacter dissulfuricans]
MNIALIVGASGTGKDTLLRTAGHYFASNHRIVFLKRYITRPPDIHETNYFLDPGAFEHLLAGNFFISHWQAHGHRYGVARDHLRQVPSGGLGLVSISRTAIADFETHYPRAVTIQVQADPDTLGKRLRVRGREEPDKIDNRLARARLPVAARNLILFDNSRPLSRTGPAFISLLESLLDRSAPPRRPET